MNTYIAIDRTRWEQDSSYKEKQTNYLKRLREFGWYIDEMECIVLANADTLAFAAFKCFEELSVSS